VIIWAQANAALVDASGGVSASTVVTIASTVVTAVSVAIAVIFRQYIAQLTGTIAKQDAELQKLNDRLKFSAQKIDAMVADSIGLHSELARERALREARELVPRDSGSSPGRIPTNPSMAAVPLPLPPPKRMP
jgi:hypothetical protein